MINLGDSPTPKTVVAPTAPAGAVKSAGIRGVRRLNARQSFAFRLLRDGVVNSQAEAYRIAYCKPNLDAKSAADAAYRLFSRPAMMVAMESIRFDGIAPLMSLTERLGHLAAIIASSTATRYERIRAAEVYTKIAGDGAPELPPDPNGKPGDDSILNVTVNIFQNAPSRVRAVSPLHARNVTPAQSNGNGHSHS